MSWAAATENLSSNSEKPLIYAAGDSQTWGIVSTDARWTNLLEKKSGIPVLNCGVPGTAQKHQHEKYREVTSALKRRPDLLLVVYITNDIAEDARFPAYTVIDGFLTMNDASQEELKARVEKGIERLRNPPLVRPHQRRLEALFVVGSEHQRAMEAGNGLPYGAANGHDV